MRVVVVVAKSCQTIDFRKEIIGKFKNGIEFSDLVSQYSLARSTIFIFTGINEL